MIFPSAWLQDALVAPRKMTWSCGDSWPMGVLDSQLNLAGRSKSPDRKAEGTSVVADGTKPRPSADRCRGKCKPCVFFVSNRGCTSSTCTSCHLDHKPLTKRRPLKADRDFFKATVESVFQQEQAGCAGPCWRKVLQGIKIPFLILCTHQI